MMGEQANYFIPKKDEVKWFVYFVPTVTMPELAPNTGSIIEMFPAIRQGVPNDYWDEQKTERAVESGLKALSRLHDIEIVAKRVRSPRDFQARMHLFTGTARFPHVSQIPGLYQAGQTTYPGFGVAPAAMSGIFAAETLLKTKNI
jgi:phytoene dehydrogenase-like protein